MENMCKIWKSRKLTIYGKVLIINSVILSQLIYKMSCLPNIPDKVKTSIKRMCSNFLWNSHTPKIQHNILINNYDEGGIKLIDLNAKEKAIKISWIKRLLTKESNWTNIAIRKFKIIGNKIWNANLNEKDADNLIDKNCVSIWPDVLKAWSTYNFHEPETGVLNQFMWLNSHIKIGKKPVLFQKAFNNNILHIKDIRTNNRFLNFDELENKYGKTINFVQYYSLTTVIKKKWGHILNSEINNEEIPNPNQNINSIISDNKMSKTVYHKLIKTYKKTPEKPKHKWENILQIKIDEDIWLNYFTNIYLHTNYNKLRYFQYRILNNILVTNDKLKIWKILDNDNCTFCNIHKETVIHLLIECDAVKHIWTKLKSWLSKKVNEDMVLNQQDILFGYKTNDENFKAVNTIITITKHYIYAQRCLKNIPNYNEILYQIKFQKQVEKSIAVNKNKETTHEAKWVNFNNIEY